MLASGLLLQAACLPASASAMSCGHQTVDVVPAARRGSKGMLSSSSSRVEVPMSGSDRRSGGDSAVSRRGGDGQGALSSSSSSGDHRLHLAALSLGGAALNLNLNLNMDKVGYQISKASSGVCVCVLGASGAPVECAMG